MKVICDLLCKFCFPTTRASQEEHDERTIWIDGATLTHVDSRCNRLNWTHVSNDSVSNDSLNLNCEGDSRWQLQAVLGVLYNAHHSFQSGHSLVIRFCIIFKLKIDT